MNLLTSLFLIFASTYSLAETNFPKVDFRYSRLLDNICAKQNKAPLSPDWVLELRQRIPEFQKAWNKDGPSLLKTLVKLTGKKFKHRDLLAALVTCRKMPSISFPLTVNMGWYLKSMRPKPLAARFFVGIVFHELLHIFVVENISTSSPLLKKYQGEKGRVKGHLFVNALQKAVYLHLGQSSRLEETIKFEKGFGADYIRAWEIINKLEGHQAFVDELAK